MELLHDYYTRPIKNNAQVTQEVNEINTVIKPDEKDEVQCSNTNHFYQNKQKEQPREKIWTIPFLLESPRSKEFQPPDLEIVFFLLRSRIKYHKRRATTLYSHERMYSYNIHTYRIRISDTWIKTPNSSIYRSQTDYISFYTEIKSQP